MDIVEMHERALDQTGQIVAGVQPDQLGLPTPCTEWDVRTLLSHLIGGNFNNAATARGGPRERDRREEFSENPSEAYQRSADAVRQAWREPGRLEQQYEMPMGTLPGQGVLGIRLIETLTHGWDLARATGQEPAFDDDLVRTALAMARAQMFPDRTGSPFAPAVEVGEDQPAIDRLAGFMGRQP